MTLEQRITELEHANTTGAERLRFVLAENARLREAMEQARLLLQDEQRLGGMRCFASHALRVLSSAGPNDKVQGHGRNVAE